MNTHEIDGQIFTAIRIQTPRPHWILKAPNGMTLTAGQGGLDNSTRPRLWASLEYLRKRIGHAQFADEFLVDAAA